MEDLPIRVVSGQVELEDARSLCDRTARALDNWVRVAQNFNQCKPDNFDSEHR